MFLSVVAGVLFVSQVFLVSRFCDNAFRTHIETRYGELFSQQRIRDHSRRRYTFFCTALRVLQVDILISLCGEDDTIFAVSTPTFVRRVRHLEGCLVLFPPAN